VSKVKLLVGEVRRNESSKAIQACNDYLRMGAGRSIAKLHQAYIDSSHKNAPPTTSIRWMGEWSRKYNWVDRSKEWDAQSDERKTLEYNLAMKNGLALDFERVNSLKKLALFLEGQIYEQGAEGKYHNVWLPDVKSVGYGENSEIVNIERFNAGILQQYRGTLDDLAKETGGRIVKSEFSGDVRVEDYREELQRRIFDIATRIEEESISGEPD